VPDFAEPPGLRFAVIDQVRVLEFEDEAVVFNPLSWDAHLLNPAAIAVLELLLEAPRSEDEIAAFLTEALQPEEQSQATAYAQRLINELQTLGLVRLGESTASANR